MSSITFGGLASGIDTNAIVTELMKLEHRPIDRLEEDKQYFQSRLKAFSGFDEKLKNLSSSLEDLDTADEFRSYKASAASEEYFSMDASSTARPGSYSIEVVHLAQVQKDVSNGYASASDGNFTAGTIDINGTSITVDDGDALSTIVDKINTANSGDSATGVSAALINDGTGNGYRIVLSGEDASTSFSASVNGVGSNGTALTFANTQAAQQAEVNVDGITIVSNNNTLKEAIPGVTLSLLKENEAAETTRLDVAVDEEGIRTKVDAFVSAYNDIIKFIADQNDSSWGHDSSLQGTKRKLQGLLTETLGGSGAFQHLVDIGIKTNKDDGTISLDKSKFDDALAGNLDDVEKLFVGENGVDGIAKRFTAYLDTMTDSIDGLYASKKTSTDQTIKRIDNNIDSLERRLEQREKTLRAQFDAMETLMGSLNSTSSYLTQQFNLLNTTKK